MFALGEAQPDQLLRSSWCPCLKKPHPHQLVCCSRCPSWKEAVPPQLVRSSLSIRLHRLHAHTRSLRNLGCPRVAHQHAKTCTREEVHAQQRKARQQHNKRKTTREWPHRKHVLVWNPTARCDTARIHTRAIYPPSYPGSYTPDSTLRSSFHIQNQLYASRCYWWSTSITVIGP